MNWEALGAFSELVGAAGVIGSLLYLAAQVRTGNRASAVQAKLESTRLLNDFMDLLIQRPELNQLMLKARKGLDSLTPDEYLHFSNMSLKAFWFFSAGHFQFRRRTLAEGDWAEIKAVLDYWLRSEGCRDWWENLGRSMYGDTFIAFIESEISKLAALPGHSTEQKGYTNCRQVEDASRSSTR
ncbi:MAG: hypothetical protein HC882_08885 [Acidobacteria bacterium]|nr:hypothetical protein [Acidobacteriota bacterium]